MADNSSPLFRKLDEGLIRRVQQDRKARASFFSEELFSDPAWDILLELYARKLAQQRVSISAATAAAGVPTSTGLRWIKKLEQEGVIARQTDPLDSRRCWLALTARGASLMRDYFDEVSGTTPPL